MRDLLLSDGLHCLFSFDVKSQKDCSRVYADVLGTCMHRSWQAWLTTYVLICMYTVEGALLNISLYMYV